MKEKLYGLVLDQSQKLLEMADAIFDRPEYDGEEYFAAGLLEDYLEENGFRVERGLPDWPTAFRATWPLHLRNRGGAEKRRYPEAL